MLISVMRCLTSAATRKLGGPIELALAMSKEEGDDRAEAVSIMQLGSIALEEGNLSDAKSRYKKALETFRVGEKTTEATAWHSSKFDIAREPL